MVNDFKGNKVRQFLCVITTCLAIGVFSPAAQPQNAEPIVEPGKEPLIRPMAAPASKMQLTNFYYLSHDSRSMTRGGSMVITDGIITSIDDVVIPCPGCDFLDLEGGFLIPGLMDLHQHLNVGGFAKESVEQKLAILKRDLYWGITTVYNPNIKLPLLAAVRQATAKNPSGYPTVFAAGQNIGVPGGWGDKSVSTYVEFKNAATLQLAGGADNIKVSMDDMSWLSSTPMAQFPGQLLNQAVQLMHANGRRLFLHASQAKDVKTALDAGVDVILHGTVDTALDRETLSRLAAKQIGYISTLALSETISDVRKSVAMQRSFDPDLINGALLYDNLDSDLMATNWRDWWDKSYLLAQKLPILRGNTLALIKAGGLVGIGTDAGTPSIIFGASLPYEMVLHEQLGLSPLAVIRMASYNNARILKIEDHTGSIEVGKEADLVLLRKDPTNSIRAINSTEWAMQNGVITYRREHTTGAGN